MSSKLLTGLNESPELIAQELGGGAASHASQREASMKVLSLLLRNRTGVLGTAGSSAPQ